jgi:hypothetical protein
MMGNNVYQWGDALSAISPSNSNNSVMLISSQPGYESIISLLKTKAAGLGFTVSAFSNELPSSGVLVVMTSSQYAAIKTMLFFQTKNLNHWLHNARIFTHDKSLLTDARSPASLLPLNKEDGNTPADLQKSLLTLFVKWKADNLHDIKQFENEVSLYSEFRDYVFSLDIMKKGASHELLIYRVITSYAEVKHNMEAGVDYVVSDDQVYWAYGDSFSASASQEPFLHRTAVFLTGSNNIGEHDTHLSVEVFPSAFLGDVTEVGFPFKIGDSGSHDNIQYSLSDSQSIQNHKLNEIIASEKGSLIAIVARSKEIITALSGLPHGRFHVMSHERYLFSCDSYDYVINMEMPTSKFLWERFNEKSAASGTVYHNLYKQDVLYNDIEQAAIGLLIMEFAQEEHRTHAVVKLVKLWTSIWSRSSYDVNEKAIRLFAYKIKQLDKARLIASSDSLSVEDKINTLKLNTNNTPINECESSLYIWVFFISSVHRKIVNLSQAEVYTPLVSIAEKAIENTYDRELDVWKGLIHE